MILELIAELRKARERTHRAQKNAEAADVARWLSLIASQLICWVRLLCASLLCYRKSALRLQRKIFLGLRGPHCGKIGTRPSSGRDRHEKSGERCFRDQSWPRCACLRRWPFRRMALQVGLLL